MRTPNTPAEPGPIEMLAQWEGPARVEPGALLEPRQAHDLVAREDMAGVAAWVAVTAVAGSADNHATEEIREHVLSVLTAWRRRFGQTKTDDLKQQVYELIRTKGPKRKISDEELTQRLNSLFARIAG